MPAAPSAAFAAAYEVSTVPEQIYSRVFRALRPGAMEPEIRVEFRKYAGARAQIRLKAGVLQVKIADTLAVAPDEVQVALAEILLAKLYRLRVPAASQATYRKYLNRKDVRDEMEQTRRARGRKLMGEPEGAHFNLVEIFDELNFQYFFGLMARPALGWSRQASRTMLGHYDPSHHTVVLSRILDRADVPKLAVEYVMYHEMLHLRHPVEHQGERRCVHTAAFKAEEKKFAQLREAKKLLKTLV